MNAAAPRRLTAARAAKRLEMDSPRARQQLAVLVVEENATLLRQTVDRLRRTSFRTPGFSAVSRRPPRSVHRRASVPASRRAFHHPNRTSPARIQATTPSSPELAAVIEPEARPA